MDRQRNLIRLSVILRSSRTLLPDKISRNPNKYDYKSENYNIRDNNVKSNIQITSYRSKLFT